MHKTCTDAIRALERSPQTANTHRDKESCKCADPSPCDWSGNGVYYACLQQKSEAPARVYTNMKSGGYALLLPAK